ncbi:hypothetical protein L6270_01365 [Candidatus Parcubacteria bacterium]|nr:hypothetical protein [Patescibacteria group bacterium]MBU4309789.1 hypothetical protein [Patescibacteria group bacterium]MBU4431795.1 hypothetical protein [Patescibacteria group bacterium]MBU4578128.1 hypothetical protein [Patescibacteria group bacterium]MCG2696665.1 hypothetical protein [Candidatus Parcubacteria bacterium]
MNLRERMEKFNKRWSVESSESYEEAFKKFKTRILNIFKNIDSYVSKESVSLFCQYYGIEEVWKSETFGDRVWSKNIENRLYQENSEKEFYRLIELIFSLEISSRTGYDRRDIYSRSILYDKVLDAVNYSDINLSITVAGDDVILYPKGEEVLDDKLVDHPLSFLKSNSADHFVQALKFYQAKNYIKSADSLRRTLEEFLKYVMKNTRGLNANILELQKKLKTDGRDAQVRNIIGSIFNYLDTYFNENSKHNDGEINDSENEFLIYQTGLLLRYVNNNL